jgi:hypothetical protein
MANYNCTQLGCVSALTGTYSTLQSCQSACVGWGCPPQLTTNTNIIFAYDGSGSYANSESRLGMFKSATAWTETLAQAGWVGTEDHTIMQMNSLVNPYYQPQNINTSSGTITLNNWSNISEDWLLWGSIPYILTNQLNGTRNVPTNLTDMLYPGSSELRFL